MEELTSLDAEDLPDTRTVVQSTQAPSNLSNCNEHPLQFSLARFEIGGLLVCLIRVSTVCHPAGARTPWYARIPTASAVGYDLPSFRDCLNRSTTTNFASARDSGYYRHAKFFEQGDDVPLPVRWRYKLDRWRSQIAAMFQSEPKALRPRLCPACGTLVGSTATKCHQCGANMTFSFAAASRSLGRWMPQTSPVTYVILAICCVMYALSFVITMKFSGGEGAGGGLMNLGGIATQVNYRLGASLPLGGFLGGPGNIAQPWRFVTAIFLHGGLLHIGFNMWVLMDIGPMVEELYGSAKYLFLYVVTGVAGYLLSSFAGHLSVGASGSLLGLVGVLLAATTGRKSMAAQALRSALIRWLIYLAVLGFLTRGMTDNYAHIGGLASGYMLGRLMPDRTPADLSERRLANFLGWAAGITIAVSFGFMVVNYLQNT
jgi:rhomboid protease GluP